MNDDIKRMAVETIMDRLFNASAWFDICRVHDIGEMLGVNPRNHADYNVLHAMHCIHYNTMRPELRNALPEMVARVCSIQRFTITKEEISLPQPVVVEMPKPRGLLSFLKVKG